MLVESLGRIAVDQHRIRRGVMPFTLGPMQAGSNDGPEAHFVQRVGQGCVGGPCRTRIHLVAPHTSRRHDTKPVQKLAGGHAPNNRSISGSLVSTTNDSSMADRDLSAAAIRRVNAISRGSSGANTLFVTERCNSRCLMCSQPPRDEDDSWRIDELLALIPLVDPDEVQLGVSGGEPTLLRADLGLLIDACSSSLPGTSLHILTNGRAFRDPALARELAGRRQDRTTWAVPLYADHAQLHDVVVDAEGAFDETLQGLYELGRLGAQVEIWVAPRR